MKNIINNLTITAILFALPLFIKAQMGNTGIVDAPIEESYTGNWKFEAPDAPEGSTKGDIEVKPHVVIMKFDNTISFPSSWVKFRNDSIIYQTAFDIATVVFSVKIIDRNHMEGKAVWKDGETLFIMTKDLGIIL